MAQNALERAARAGGTQRPGLVRGGISSFRAPASPGGRRPGRDRQPEPSADRPVGGLR